MTGRSRVLAAMLAALMIMIMAVAAGCASGRNVFKRAQDGRLEYTEGSDVWKWDRKGNTAQILLNDKLFAVLQNSVAHVSLPDGRSLDVTVDGNGAPVSVKAAWGLALSQSDYKLMSTAFFVNNEAGNQGQPSSLGLVILLLIVAVAGVLLFIYAGSLVNSWKLGGIFGGNDTAKSLLIVKASGIFLVAVGVILLLIVIF